MAFCFCILQVQGAAERFQRVVVRLLELRNRHSELLRPFVHLLLQVQLVALVFQHQPPVLQRPPDSQEELVFLKRLQDVVISAAPDSLERGGNIMDCGHHDHGHLWIMASEPVKQLDAIHFRHDHVAQYKVRRLPPHALLGRPAIAYGSTTVAPRFEHCRNNFANRFLVIHHQDVFQVHVDISPKHHYKGRHTTFVVLLPSKKIAC